MAGQLSNPNKLNVVEMAKKQRHIHLYEKLQQKKILSRSEINELNKYEGPETTDGVVDTAARVAKAFGVSLRTVMYWIRDGMPVRSDKQYDLKDIQAWRVARKDKRGTQSSDKKNLAYWESEYREYKARKEKALYLKSIGSLIEREKIENDLIALITVIKRVFLALPRGLAPTLVGLEPREIEEKLAEKINEAITLFAQEKIFVEKKAVKRRDKNRKTKNMDQSDPGSVGAPAAPDGVAVG